MSFFSYSAEELFHWITVSNDILILDVRNDKDFKKFHIEGPCKLDMLNVSYYDFMEIEQKSVDKIPRNKSIRIVCAKEGSAKYVAEILEKHGFQDVGYLSGGIKTWGNLLIPKEVYSGDDFELYQFIRPGKTSCSYGLIHADEIMLFDPSSNVEFYLHFAQEKGCKIIKTFETHLQADYIAGSRIISEKTAAQFLANENDFKTSKNIYTPLHDNEKISFTTGKPLAHVLFTPGHTPGSTSFIIAEKFLISGDTVFIKSIGRPDLGGKAEEWSKLLFETIKKIKTLDEKLLVLPGHFIDWEEATENLVFCAHLSSIKKDNNNIYAIEDDKNFTLFIKDNMREQPAEYTDIRLVNANLKTLDDTERETLDLGKNECAASSYAKKKATGQA